jgi:hypothetical protein
LVRSHLYVITTEDLKGKVVSLGPKGSGTEQTARAVLEASGVSLREVEVKSLAMDQVAPELGVESIDVAFVTSAVPTPSVENALRDQDARLLPLESNLIDRLTKGGGYFETSIPKRTYTNQTQDLPTAGVRALLLSVDDIDPNAVGGIVQILYKERGDLQRATGIQLELLGPGTVTGLPIPFHAAAMRYLGTGVAEWVVLVVSLLVIGALGVLLYRRRSLIRRSLTPRMEMLRVFAVILAIWATGAGALYFFERHVNENLDTFWKAAWSMVVYVAGGFRTRVPFTRGGEVVSVLVILLGAGAVAWFVAELASHFVRAELTRLVEVITGRRAMPQELEDHMVIVNWDSRVQSMVKQLNGPDFKEQKRIVVVSPAQIEFPQDAEFRTVINVVGDPTDSNVLARARVQYAYSVTIVSAWTSAEPMDGRGTPDADVADSKTIMSILAIRALCRQHSPRASVPITAEIKGRKNIDLAVAASQGGDIETICVEEFGADILCQCALTPGLAKLYVDLLTFEPGTNEVYKTKIPTEFQGKTFGDLLHHFAQKRQSGETAIIPIGVHRGSSLFLNPGDDQLGALQDGDSIFVISDHRPEFLS